MPDSPEPAAADHDGWTGRPLPRREDPQLLTGRARYIADLTRPGMLSAAFFRSPFPHARIRSINVEEALAMPGVHGLLTGADLPDDLRPQPKISQYPERPTPFYALTKDRVRYVGEPIAVVAAESRYVAEDAVEKIRVEWDHLPSVGRVRDALGSEAPLLYDDWPDNVAGTFESEMGDVDAALEQAAVIIEEEFDIQRQFASPLEGRGVLAEWDPHRNELEVWTSSQILHIARDFLAEVLGLPEHRIRVRVPQIGGAFGCKFHFYPEEVAISLLARKTSRPVHWVEDRSETFQATVHAREEKARVRMAATESGEITAIEAEILGDMGAYLHMVSYGPMWLTSVMITNAYQIPNARVHAQAVVTNKTPFGSYRGWGQPQANFVVERMVDRLARALEMDPVEVRRKNLVTPDLFPYKSLHHVFDSGEYHELLERALKASDYERWQERKSQLREQGRYLGVGLSFYVENTALGPSRILTEGGLRQGGYDISRIRIEPSGEVMIFTGLCEMGQGFTNGLTQLCADTLGVHPDQITVITGDTQSTPYTGYGTGASRSAAVGGAAVLQASEKLRSKILEIAANRLEASVHDLEIKDGRIWVRGVPSSEITMADVGRAAYHRAVELPEGMDPGLEVVHTFDPPQMAWPYGVCVIVVEVDVGTGGIEILDVAFIHDCGTILNEMIVEGQIHGGVAQGIAAALHEKLEYDEYGQLLTTTFMDYVLPTAADLPRFKLDHMVTPSPIIPGGMKGVGEAGAIPAPAAVVNAIEDALRPFEVKFTSTPVTPDTVLQSLAGKLDRPLKA